MEVAEFGEMFGGSVNVLGNYLGGWEGGREKGWNCLSHFY